MVQSTLHKLSEVLSSERKSHNCHIIDLSSHKCHLRRFSRETTILHYKMTEVSQNLTASFENSTISEFGLHRTDTKY
jgi:hypothetical protein